MTSLIGARWTARQLAMIRTMGIDLGARPCDDREGAAGARAADATSTARPTASPPDRIERSIDDLATSASAATVSRGAAAEALVQPAHWLVVGEPMAAGSPPAKLLSAMLRAVGLLAAPDAPRERRAVLALFEPGTDVEFDRARLLDAVQRAAPRCIVVFGRAPAQALLSTELPLAELRGRVHRLGERPVVVTYALPYLLRQPAEKARAWDDLCLATRACEATA